MNFLEKLRSLSQPKKIAIFFVVMGISALVVGFIGMRLIVNDIDKAKDSLKSVQLPNIDLPKIDLPSMDINNVSESNQDIIQNQNDTINLNTP